MALKLSDELIWMKAGDLIAINNIAVNSKEKGKVVVNVNGSIENPGTKVNLVYTILGSGEVKVDYGVVIDKSAPNVPRIGMTFDISNTYRALSYFGKGPQANYQDRNYGSDVGLFSGDALTMSYDYAYPQEYGNHTETRWFKTENKAGKGVLITSETFLNFSVIPYSLQNLQDANHMNQLVDRDVLSVYIDLKQQGVGGDDTWTDRAQAHDKYLIKPGTYSHSFYLVPFSSKLKDENIRF